MTTQHIETLIVGAGRPARDRVHLQQMGRPCLLVDRGARIGDNWRAHYDSLRLYTPAKYSSLPGLPFPTRTPGRIRARTTSPTTWSSMRCSSTCRCGCAPASTGSRPARAAAYVATLGEDTITADNVVVATGTFGRTPYVPDVARRLDPGIRQLHSSEYKHPGQLRDGAVLVVGASHSGTDIAYELAARRETILAGRDCGQISVRWDSRAIRLALPVLVFAWQHVLTRRTPIGRRVMREARAHGGPMLRVKRDDLARRGVQRYPARVTDATAGLPTLADNTVLDVRNIVWCTGFRQVFDWIELPIVGADGWPAEYRGVVENAPGLFFCGLSFQFGFSSMVLPGRRPGRAFRCPAHRRPHSDAVGARSTRLIGGVSS